MYPHYSTLVAMVTITMMCASIAIAETNDDERTDRSVFNRLERQLQQVERDYARVMEQAMDEAREDEEGEASLETRSELIALRNKRDRLLNRMTVIALRWGWDMPDFDPDEAIRERQDRPNEWEQVFEPADRLIRTRFQRESRLIAQRVVMPVISLPGS